MVLSKEHPRMVRYRSAEPVLTPELPQERRGIVANVVFPTGIDRRDDLGSPIASTFITGWQTTGSAWHVLTCRNTCPQGHSRTVGTSDRGQRLVPCVLRHQ
jgi:hypothetical protein